MNDQITNQIFSEEQSKTPSIIADPFGFEKITSIHLHSYNWGNRWTHSGSVNFKNGNTKGEQIFECNSIDGVLKKIHTFINELNNAV